MKVFYSPYRLTPLKRANRLSSMDSKSGVLLKGVLGNKTTFADYFPHIAFNDRSSDQFLDEFKFQKEVYDKKVFDFLLRDHLLYWLKPKKFFNHQLWTGLDPLLASTIKYKLLHKEDRTFMIPLEQGKFVRLDANALFNRAEYEYFVKDIPEKYLPRIHYMEDPLMDKDWSGLILKSAKDFINGTPFDFAIYKANCEFKPETEAKIIYSSYLGHDLGRWHAYCEVVETGDLTFEHGIHTPGYFQEEKNFFEGNYQDGFIADTQKVQKLYREVSDLKWKLLCSI